MKTPEPNLMRAYGTDVVFKEKTADVQPIAARIAQLAMARSANMRRMDPLSARHTMWAERLNTAFRMIELEKMESAIDNANHTVAPMILPAGYSDMPIGMTEGMIRMASVAGENMAKMAGNPYRAFAAPVSQAASTVASTGSSLKDSLVDQGTHAADQAGKLWKRTGLSEGKWKYKLPMLAGAGLATYGAVQGVKKVLNWAGQETPPPTYGAGQMQVAPDLNEYGQPQPRLPGTYT